MADGRRLAAYDALLHRVGGWSNVQTRDDLFARLASAVRELAPDEAVGLWIYEPSDQMLRRGMFEGPETLARLASMTVPLDFGPAGRAFQAQTAVALRLEAKPAPPVATMLFEAGFRAMCVVPASADDVRYGIFGVASRDDEDVAPEVVAVLERIGAALARAIARTPAGDSGGPPPTAAVTPGDRAQLLLRVTNAVTSERHLPDLLVTISTLLRETIHHHYASLSLWDEQAPGLRRWAAVLPTPLEMIREGDLLDRNDPPWLAFESGDVIVIRGGDLDAVDTPATSALVATGLRSGVCLPLKTPRGKYGVLNVGSPAENAFPIEEVMLLWQIARQLAVAIENAISFDRAEQYRLEAIAGRDRFKLLLDINNALVTQLDPDAPWPPVFEVVRRAVDHDYASLLVLDAQRALHLEAATSYDDQRVLAQQTVVPLDRTPAAVAFAQNAPCVFRGAALDRFDADEIRAMRQRGLQSLCCVPLATRNRVIGALNIASRRSDAFSPAEIELLRDIAGQVAIAVENVLAFREISELKNRLAGEKLYLEDEIKSEHDFKEIVGNSPTLKRVLQQIQTVAPTEATVLLLGETGTGKELLARALHDLSTRRERAFIRLNAAALPLPLIESELFGYDKGAFTGAVGAKAGRLELADRGTLFLDEVGDMPLEVQPKLLRALQEREFERLGSMTTKRVDIRLLAATNRNLEDMVADASFRSDLYYRLSVFPIHVPALRERREDVPALVHHFAHKFSRRLGRTITTIPKSTMEELQQWQWPGNIRELQNVIERAVILSTGSTLRVSLGPSRDGAKRRAGAAAHHESKYQAGERAMILKALRESNGIIAGPSGAAARLGLKRTTLHAKMQKLGITRPRF
jgi:formate hydrogenlyase transcriptional activator